MSEYGLQMREKQESKNSSTAYWKNSSRGYYAQAEKIAKKEGIPGENLLMLLENETGQRNVQTGLRQNKKRS